MGCLDGHRFLKKQTKNDDNRIFKKIKLKR